MCIKPLHFSSSPLLFTLHHCMFACCLVQ